MPDSTSQFMCHGVYNGKMSKRAIRGTIFIGSLTAAIVGLGFLLATQWVDLSPTFPKNRIIGVWDWTAPDSETSAQKIAHADALKNLGVTDCYIDISSYIDHAEIPNLQTRKQQLDTFTRGLHEEVSTLTSRGIRAHALAGNTRWSNPDYAYIPLKILQYVHAYDESSSVNQQLASIQFDVEFYSDKNFSSAPEQDTKDYLTLVDQLITARNQTFTTSDSHVPLGFTIPTWFDGSNPDMPKLDQPIAVQLIEKLQKVPGSYLAIMDYRNQTGGEDGSIAKAQTFFNIANDAHSPVKFLIGQETTDVQPAKITFYGKHQSSLINATTTLNTTFGHYPQFAGFIINDQNGLLTLPR